MGDAHLWTSSFSNIETKLPLKFITDEPITNRYLITKKVLGTGVNGSVLFAYRKSDKQKFAVKSFYSTPTNLREINLHWNCSGHPNIVNIIDVYEDHRAARPRLFMVMECMEGGELFDRLQTKETFTEREASVLMRSMASCIAYLHGKAIAHRDLKLENFLFTTTEDDAVIKLTDFGFAKELNFETPCYTPYYAAPEVLRNEGFRIEYDHSCDLWSLGVIMFMMLSGRPPFYSQFGGALSPGMKSRILNGTYEFDDDEWIAISKEAKDLVRSMLSVDTSKRPTAKEMLNHPWLREPSNVPQTPLPTINALNAFYSPEGDVHHLTMEDIKGDMASAVSEQRHEDPGFKLGSMTQMNNSLLEKRKNKNKS